jgi:predicted phosphodiesterase
MTARTRFLRFAFALHALAWPAGAGAQAPPASGQTLRFFFVADMHSRHRHMELLLADIAREQPGIIVDGGDFVHDGTEAEFRRAFSDRQRAGVPWLVVRGNHDALLRGPFAAAPPEFAQFAVVEHAGYRFVLLDNHDGTLSDEQFAALAGELERHGGARSIVVMHVPALVGRVPAAARLRRLLPFRLEEPSMPDAAQVERFTALAARHGVALVLTGHTHAPSEAVRDGVRYTVAGAAGGLTPGLGIANEYLDITLHDGDVHVRRVVLRSPAGDPFSFLVRAFRFYSELNSFNHSELGWTYVPSASVQLRTSTVAAEVGGADRVLLQVGAEFERMPSPTARHSFLADASLLAGRRDAALQLAAGARLRAVGSWNRNVHVVAGVNGNAGVLAGAWTAGLGVQAGVGAELRAFTLEVGATHATNHRAVRVSAGRRF